MDDLISRQAAIDALDTGLWGVEWDKALATAMLKDLPSAQPDVPDTNVGDLISRQAAIDALWKAMYEFEDKMEKQFSESDNLDVYDWIQHRIFVQNMSDIDRKTILDLPSAKHEQKPGRWNFIGDNMFECTNCKVVYTTNQLNSLRNYDTDPYAPRFCPNCGADMRGEQDE